MTWHKIILQSLKDVGNGSFLWTDINLYLQSQPLRNLWDSKFLEKHETRTTSDSGVFLILVQI